MTKSGNDNGVSLRPHMLADIDVVAIERESFPENLFPAIVFTNFVTLAREGFIVACAGDSVVGYVIGTSSGTEGMIQSVAVTPSFRRRGVGAMLIGSVIERLSVEHQRISLLVDVNNEAAVHLYRRFSFSRTGRVIRSYYSNGNDAVEMSRETDSDRGAR